MGQSALISVIVPVYNTEACLNRCVGSIVSQTYQNLEIILVDDGSSDNSGTMCDAWAARDSRIKVIHKENGGSADARNRGLDMAAGAFVAMVDSDDYLEPHMYSHLLGLMSEDVDIAECGYLEAAGEDAPLDDGHVCQVQTFSVQEALSCHIADTLFRQLVWNKLYRAGVTAGIRFPTGAQIDDEFWTYRVIANARKLARSSSRMYAYRQRPQSAMHSAFSAARLQAVEAKCQRLEFFKDRFPELVPQAKANLFSTCLYMGQMSLRYLEGEERKRAFKMLRAVRARYPLSREDRRALPRKQQAWEMLARIALIPACRLRNFLKIGL